MESLPQELHRHILSSVPVSKPMLTNKYYQSLALDEYCKNFNPTTTQLFTYIYKTKLPYALFKLQTDKHQNNYTTNLLTITLHNYENMSVINYRYNQDTAKGKIRNRSIGIEVTTPLFTYLSQPDFSYDAISYSLDLYSYYVLATLYCHPNYAKLFVIKKLDEVYGNISKNDKYVLKDQYLVLIVSAIVLDLVPIEQIEFDFEHGEYTYFIKKSKQLYDMLYDYFSYL